MNVDRICAHDITEAEAEDGAGDHHGRDAGPNDHEDIRPGCAQRTQDGEAFPLKLYQCHQSGHDRCDNQQLRGQCHHVEDGSDIAQHGV